MLLKHGANLNIKSNYGETQLPSAARLGYKKVVENILNFIKDGAKISDNKITQLEYLCSLNKILRKKCQIFLMTNKRKPGFLKIPKPICYEILLKSWDATQCITALVNAKDNKAKTALDLARGAHNDNPEIKTLETIILLEPYEKIVEII
jgi:hypothetical protein